ncbi:MAG: hypothetical protein QXI71_02695 [Candidatus Bathyarchaeia archaeon]
MNEDDTKLMRHIVRETAAEIFDKKVWDHVSTLVNRIEARNETFKQCRA